MAVTSALTELRAVRALHGEAMVSLRVERGERVALVGRNGVGKTSLLRVLAGLDAPREGAVTLAPSVGYAPQDYRASLLPWLSVRDNVALALRGSPTHEAEVRDALAVVGLPEETLGRYPGRLSGGEQQRVALARALAWDAPLVLLDEPTSALDAPTRAALRPRLGAWLAARHRACVLVSHDLDDVTALCSRWVHLGGDLTPRPPLDEWRGGVRGE